MGNCATKVLDVKENNQLVLNGNEVECKLNAINDSVKIIPIFGETRLGKSYIMNVLNYKLENRKEFSLCGFESKKGFKSVTRGLWAISSTSGHSSSSSFLLCDTEGAFEVGKSNDFSAKLLALSAILSSCLILNIAKRISANELNFFNAFLSHANFENSNKFNELIFLVRDWPNSDEFEYGLIGGNKYLESLDDDLLKKISCRFAKTQCFLLPYIGHEQEINKKYSQYYKVENEDVQIEIGEFVRNEFDQCCNMFVEDVILKVGKSYDSKLVKERLKNAIEIINNNENILVFDLQKATDEVLLLQNQNMNMSEEIQHLHHELNSKDAKIENLKGQLIDVKKKRQEETNFFEEKIKSMTEERQKQISTLKNYFEELLIKANNIANNNVRRKWVEKIISDVRKLNNGNEDLENLCRKYEEKLENHKNSADFWSTIGDFIRDFAREALEILDRILD